MRKIVGVALLKRNRIPLAIADVVRILCPVSR
jgi:hypothetical protein